MRVYLTVFGKPRYLGIAKIRNEIYEANSNFFEKHCNSWVVLQTQRGLELGLIAGALSPEQEDKYKFATSKFEDSTEKILQSVEFVRIADEGKIANYYRQRRDEAMFLVRAREIALQHNLKMKLVDVEYTLDRKKMYVYFTSEQRVDFRVYVRELAHEFKTRIEMRQIGFRDEARIVRGIASCGRPCCCSYWLRGFSSIGIKMVKEQKFELNPTKISGLCGRLMCCMSYEQSLYSELWAKLPGPGSKIKTDQGFYVLESLDIGREYVHVRFPSGRLVSIAISEFQDFQETVLSGKEWENANTPKTPTVSARRVRVLRGARSGYSQDQKPDRKPDKKSERKSQKKFKRKHRYSKRTDSKRTGSKKAGGKHES